MSDADTDRPNGWRKAQVLRYLSERGESPTGEIADGLDTTRSNIRNVLARLRDQRRVETEDGKFVPQAGRRESTHAVTDRGEEYLDWWVSEGRELPDLPQPAW